MKISVLIDTSLFRLYERDRNSHRIDGDELNRDLNAFKELLRCDAVIWHYTDTITFELGDHFGETWHNFILTFKFQKISALRLLDGSFKLDGSGNLGGNFGGSLKEHIERKDYLEAYVKELESGNMGAAWKARNQRGDIELMEAALEHDIPHFLTVDYRRIDSVATYSKKNPNCEATQRISKVIKRPIQLLSEIPSGSSE
ncbi:MAG: hypothetical protein HQK87_01650 [Nitrospinae bacterium]|nr:hypothetical protein [Nitrospinota bacterium]